MSRRALDLLFASGAAAIAVLMVVLGFVLADQASFAEDYVKEQLGEQKITFATAEDLKKDEENPANAEYKKITQWKEGSSCLNEYAGKAMTTGKMPNATATTTSACTWLAPPPSPRSTARTWAGKARRTPPSAPSAPT